MIPIEPQYGFVIYVLAWFIVLTILWAREIWRVKTYDWELSKDRLAVCDDCHYTFLIKDQKNICRCPKCNSVCFFRKKI